MALSNELISQFAKSVVSDKKTNTEATVYGEVVTDGNGNKYVRLDGSDQLTPVSSTADANGGDRVTVMIKDHTATVTGNLSSPAARTDDVKEMGTKISEFDIVIADRITVDDITAINGMFDELRAEIADIENLEAVNAQIETIIAKYATLDYITAKDIDAVNIEVEKLRAIFGEFTDISTEKLEAINAHINNLTAYNAEFTYVSAEKLKAFKAEIETLETNKLNATFANIDFANVDKAAINELYATSGLIENVTMENGTVTGYLVGVTIKGDLIEGGTIKADKLVIKGEDGLYYKLNYEGGSLSGDEVAKTVYYKVEFDSESNTYISTTEELPVLEGSIVEGAITDNGCEVYVTTTDEDETIYFYTQVVYPDWANNSLHGSVIVANSITATQISVSDLIAFDATIGGFNIGSGSLYSGVKETPDNSTRGIYLGNDGQVSFGDETNYLRYYKEIDPDTGEEVWRLAISAESIMFGSDLKSSAADLKELTEHVKIGTYEDPDSGDRKACVELSEGDSDFRQRITNVRTEFLNGATATTVIDSEGVTTENVTVNGEFNHDGFLWAKRSNGNYGLIWKG